MEKNKKEKEIAKKNENISFEKNAQQYWKITNYGLFNSFCRRE